MKKILFAFLSMCMFVGLTSCEKDVAEGDIVGAWEITSTEVDGQKNYDVDEQAWLFTKDHEWYVVDVEDPNPEHADADGEWSIKGKELSIYFEEEDVTMNYTIEELTTSNLVLSSNWGGNTYKYYFKKIN